MAVRAYWKGSIARSDLSAVAQPAKAEATKQSMHFRFNFQTANSVENVIPGRAKREPGIHNHDREYGFRACAKWRIPE